MNDQLRHLSPILVLRIDKETEIAFQGSMASPTEQRIWNRKVGERGTPVMIYEKHEVSSDSDSLYSSSSDSDDEPNLTNTNKSRNLIQFSKGSAKPITMKHTESSPNFSKEDKSAERRKRLMENLELSKKNQQNHQPSSKTSSISSESNVPTPQGSPSRSKINTSGGKVPKQPIDKTTKKSVSPSRTKGPSTNISKEKSSTRKSQESSGHMTKEEETTDKFKKLNINDDDDDDDDFSFACPNNILQAMNKKPSNSPRNSERMRPELEVGRSKTSRSNITENGRARKSPLPSPSGRNKWWNESPDVSPVRSHTTNTAATSPIQRTASGKMWWATKDDNSNLQKVPDPNIQQRNKFKLSKDDIDSTKDVTLKEKDYEKTEVEKVAVTPMAKTSPTPATPIARMLSMIKYDDEDDSEEEELKDEEDSSRNNDTVSPGGAHGGEVTDILSEENKSDTLTTRNSPRSQRSLAVDTDENNSQVSSKDEEISESDDQNNIILDPQASPEQFKSKESGTKKGNEEPKEPRVQLAPVSFRNSYNMKSLPKKPRPPDEIIKSNSKPKERLEIKQTVAKARIQEVIDAIKGPSIVRRANACGTLKVLSAQKSNVVMLARTTGLLDALVLAAVDKPKGEEAEAINDARTRATAAILVLAQPLENRRIVCEHTGLIECLVKVIKEDVGEARLHACSTLATLAKTEETREYIAKIKDTISVLSQLMKGVSNPPVFPGEKQVEKAVYEFPTKHDKNIELSDKGSEESSIFSDNDSLNEEINSPNKPKEEDATNPEDHDDDAVKKGIQEKFDDCLKKARLNSCAALLHISKECSVSMILARNTTLITCLADVCKETENPIHTRCLEILCNLTRFPTNNTFLSHQQEVIEALLICGESETVEDRVWVLRSFQNLSADTSSKSILTTPKVLEFLSISLMCDGDEQEPAVSALYNLCIDPSSIVLIMNSPVIGALLYIANSPDSSKSIRQIACDTLATTGMWIQTSAAGGFVPEECKPTPLPTYVSSGHLRF